MPKQRPRAIARPGPRQVKKHRQPDTKISSDAQVSRTREITVYSGRVCLGRVVLLHGGKTFRAFDAAGDLLGDFQSVGDAYTACEGAR